MSNLKNSLPFVYTGEEINTETYPFVKASDVDPFAAWVRRCPYLYVCNWRIKKSPAASSESPRNLYRIIRCRGGIFPSTKCCVIGG